MVQIGEHMRWAIISILFLLNAAPARAQSQYFPQGTFAEESDDGTFLVTWYSRQLKGLEEPSLWTLSQNDKHAVVYRFLWLRTFHHPVAVRVTIAPDRPAEIIVKMTSGAGGYAPGQLIENQTEKLSPIQVKNLLGLVNKATFWKLPTEDRNPGARDGAEWILEGVRQGNYHLVDRWTPTKGTYHDLCWFFVSDLAGMNIPRKEIY